MTDEEVGNTAYTVSKIKTASLSGGHIETIEGELLAPVPVITNSTLTQYIQENLAERIAKKKVIERRPVNSELENSSDVDWESLIEVDSIGSMNSSNELFIGKPRSFMPKENLQEMSRLQRGGYKRDELIVIASAFSFDSIKDISMRVSGLADNTVVLVNNHPIDPNIEHKVALDDVVSWRQIAMTDAKLRTVPSDEYSIYVGECGKVGAAIARRRKKAMRKLHKRKH